MVKCITFKGMYSICIKTLFSTMMARFLSDQAALINLINIMNIFLYYLTLYFQLQVTVYQVQVQLTVINTRDIQSAQQNEINQNQIYQCQN